MRRIDRYLLKEMLVPAAIGGVMVLTLLIGNWLYVLLKLLYSGAPGRDIAMILLYRIPGVFMLALPASLLLGTALGLNRLERDREIMSLRMAGVRLTRLVLPYMLVGLLFSGVLFVLQEKVIPPATHIAEKMTRKMAWGTPAAMVPRDVVFKVGQHFIYVREVEPVSKTLYGVVMCKVDQGPTWFVIPRAEYHHGKWVLLPDPFTGKKPEFYIFRMGSSPIHGEAGEGVMDLLQDDILTYLSDQPHSAEEMTFSQLQALVDGVRGPGVGGAFSLTPYVLTFQLHRKLAAPLAALVAVLIAIPLSIHFGRSGGYTGLLLSVVVAFCFVVSQQWAQVLAETSRLNPIFAAWAPNALFGLLGLVLLIREE